ncbi:glycoside hydrolase family 79 protein [Phlyctema vagabunda]|uniref:Glycoside hydrolase family 79 protein n=1 Tax=Phlyctema vagabunda TaxID=108571 RepID=A0ABR4PX35_9HELO
MGMRSTPRDEIPLESPRPITTVPSPKILTVAENENVAIAKKTSSSDTESKQRSCLLEPTRWPSVIFDGAIARPLITAASTIGALLLAMAIVLAILFSLQRKSKNQEKTGLSGNTTHTIKLSTTMEPVNSFPPVLEAFVSFAIEFAFFPDFAGNATSPNTFSDNLLNNIAEISGTKPFIRVGGNTQDYALYNSSLPVAVEGTYNYTASQNYPTQVTIGPSYFESYNTWPDVKFIHGFNMGLANTPVGWESLVQTISLACKALQNGNLLWWEYSNEADLYPTSPARILRTGDWNYTTFLDEWRNGTSAIKQEINASCPNLTSNASYGYVGPSYAYRGLDPVATFENGLNENGSIKLITMHHYMGDAREAGASLQGTLMNHTSVVDRLGSQLKEEIINLSNATLVNSLAPNTQIPMILGEANSMANNNQGPTGLLNVFGNALWTMDYMLYCAVLGISRVHMQLGTDFRYSSWQPVTTANTSISTLPPYYGNIAVAAFMGNISDQPPQIVGIGLPTEYEAAYAAYTDESLARIALINLRAYNTSSDSAPTDRPHRKYTLNVELKDGKEVGIQRLLANGSDVQTGITWDGWSYEYDLDEGRPVRLPNITVDETVLVVNGQIQVTVLDSSAVILNF